MDNFFIIIALIIGIILGGILIYFTLKSNHVSRSSYDDVNQKYIKSQAENQNLFQHLEEYRYNIQKQTELSDQTILEKQNLFGENVELKSKNDHLQAQLIQQKEEIQSIQEQAKLQFEKVANQILEEKTEKFTNMNQLNLKNILEPFEKNINELKKTVNDTYDKEAKERFITMP